jgi:hypothetical protein
LRNKNAELIECNGQIKTLMHRIDELEPLKLRLESISKEISKLGEGLDRSSSHTLKKKMTSSSSSSPPSSPESSSGGGGGGGGGGDKLISKLRYSIESALEVQVIKESRKRYICVCDYINTRERDRDCRTICLLYLYSRFISNIHLCASTQVATTIFSLL